MQKLNISDLESTFNASDKNRAVYIFGKRRKNTIISKIRTVSSKSREFQEKPSKLGN
jgi:hypothetical protein